MSDDGLTRDVSACERLILIIRFVWDNHEKGHLASNPSLIPWGELDRLQEQCDVLAPSYSEMLRVINLTYRQQD